MLNRSELNEQIQKILKNLDGRKSLSIKLIGLDQKLSDQEESELKTDLFFEYDMKKVNSNFKVFNDHLAESSFYLAGTIQKGTGTTKTAKYRDQKVISDLIDQIELIINSDLEQIIIKFDNSDIRSEYIIINLTDQDQDSDLDQELKDLIESVYKNVTPKKTRSIKRQKKIRWSKMVRI